MWRTEGPTDAMRRCAGGEGGDEAAVLSGPTRLERELECPACRVRVLVLTGPVRADAGHLHHRSAVHLS